MQPIKERTVRYLEIAMLAKDDALQARAHGIDQDVVREYAEHMQDGATFPPALVFSDGQGHWVADGYHRIAARQVCGQKTILVEVRPGSREDAIWAGCAANKTHGLRRTNADKRRSVQRALLQPRAQRLSDRQIAVHCGVHHYTVGRSRRELEAYGHIEAIELRTITRGNVSYQQQITGIQRSNSRRSTETCDRTEASPSRSTRSASRPGHDADSYVRSEPSRRERASGLRDSSAQFTPSPTASRPLPVQRRTRAGVDDVISNSGANLMEAAEGRTLRLFQQAESSVAELLGELSGGLRALRGDLARLQFPQRLNVLAEQLSSLVTTMAADRKQHEGAPKIS